MLCLRGVVVAVPAPPPPDCPPLIEIEQPLVLELLRERLLCKDPRRIDTDTD